MRIDEIVLTEEQLEEISAKDIGAGALAGMMALTPVSKAFGATQNTDPLPSKQTSTMVQKDVAGKQDLSKVSANQYKSGKFDPNSLKPGDKFYKVTVISDKGSMVKYHSIDDAKSAKELEQKYDKIIQKYNIGSYNINVQGRIMR